MRLNRSASRWLSASKSAALLDAAPLGGAPTVVSSAAAWIATDGGALSSSGWSEELLALLDPRLRHDPRPQL